MIRANLYPLLWKIKRCTQNISNTLEGKRRCHLHRSTPNADNGNSCWTSVWPLSILFPKPVFGDFLWRPRRRHVSDISNMHLCPTFTYNNKLFMLNEGEYVVLPVSAIFSFDSKYISKFNTYWALNCTFLIFQQSIE
jgi:hypothetical protein